jgi:hypothetical protein
MKLFKENSLAPPSNLAMGEQPIAKWNGEIPFLPAILNCSRKYICGIGTKCIFAKHFSKTSRLFLWPDPKMIFGEE